MSNSVKVDCSMGDKRLTGVRGNIHHLIKWSGGTAIKYAQRLKHCGAPTIQNLVLFECFAGEKADCNPRAIFDYMQSRCPGMFKFVWALKEPKRFPELASSPDTTVVQYRSDAYYRAACTANVAIFNAAQGADFPGRAAQLQIQTWHGVPYKTIGAMQRDAPWALRKMEEHKFARYNYLVSPCQQFNEKGAEEGFSYRGKILASGLPRNDCLMHADPQEIISHRRNIGLGRDDFLVLFAPTWRDSGDRVKQFDVETVRLMFKKKTGKRVVMAIRGHLHSDTATGNFDLNLSDYPSSQGLLLASDALISDYSSIIWDYSFLDRPCFLYVPDIDLYESEHGFALDFRSCGFPICESEEELISEIAGFDESSYLEAMHKHHFELGSFEEGHACATVVEAICQHCDVEFDREG